MVDLSSYTLNIGTEQSYFDAVSSFTPLGLYLLNEQLTATGARDLGSGGTDGVYAGDVDLGITSPFPHGGTAAVFDGTTGHVDLGDIAAYEFAGAFTIGVVAKWTSAAARTLFSKRIAAAVGGWALYVDTGRVGILATTAAGATVLTVESVSAFNDGEWHTVFVTWDGTTGVNGLKLYVDGVLIQSATASAGTIGGSTARLLIAAHDLGAGAETNYFPGFMAGVCAVGSVVSGVSIAAIHATTQYTDISDDVRSVSGHYGMDGFGPVDREADVGVFQFVLKNGENNSAGLLGYYSPNHVNCRSGFTFNIPVQFQMTYNSVTHTRFWGRLVVIDPEPGQNKGRNTACIAHDYMYVLADTDVRTITPQINQTEDDLIRIVLEALPPNAQPMDVDLNAGVDVFPYAFDDLGASAKAATALNKIAISTWGFIFVKGDGTLQFKNRKATTGATVQYTLDDEMMDLESPSNRTNTFDLVRVTTRPARLGTTDTEVLFSEPGVIEIATGETREHWGNYSDPSDRNRPIGGTDFQDPLVDGTDFEADTAADGSGTDISADIDIAASLFASSFRLLITNTNAATAYLVNNSGDPLLQIRGRGIYREVEVVSEARGSDHPTKPLHITLPYQDDANVGQAIADYVLSERETIENHVESISFVANYSDTLMQLLLFADPNVVISLSETATGLENAQCAIRSVAYDIQPGLTVRGTLGLRPIVVGDAFRLDEDELDDVMVGLGAL